jgi:hypothetical protein
MSVVFIEARGTATAIRADSRSAGTANAAA